VVKLVCEKNFTYKFIYCFEGAGCPPKNVILIQYVFKLDKLINKQLKYDRAKNF
jgi:hypothetical protein